MKGFRFGLINPVYNLLGLAGAMLFVYSFFAGSQTVDLHLHDTYFVIANANVLLFFGCYLLFLWIVYQLVGRKQTVKVLLNIHVWITMAVIAVALFLPFSRPRKYIDFSSYQEQNRMIAFAIILFLLAQALFVVNIFIALFQRAKEAWRKNRLN